MKKIAMLSVAFASVFGASTALADSHSSTVSLNSEQAKISYALGTQIGTNIKQSFAKQGINIITSSFLAGFADSVKGNETQMTEAQMKQALTALQEQMESKAQQQAQKMVNQHHQAIFSSNDPTVGNVKAPTTLVEFFDYQCVHCRHMAPIVSQLIKEDPNLRVVYKEFPIFGKNSVFASTAALASQKQGKYQQFHDAMMSADKPLTNEEVLTIAKQVGLNMDQLKKDMKDPSIDKQIKANQQLAQTLGINGTPAFIIGTTAKPKDEKAMSPSFFIPGAVAGKALQEAIQKIQNETTSDKFTFPDTPPAQEKAGTWPGI